LDVGDSDNRKPYPVKDTVTPYLTTLSRLGILQGEAGNRTQSEPKQIGALALTGR
jgi:hypothetical protein